MVGGGKNFIRIDWDTKTPQLVLQRYVRQLTTATEDAVQEGAFKVLATALTLVPRRTGALAASGRFSTIFPRHVADSAASF